MKSFWWSRKADGSGDNNWVDEKIRCELEVGDDRSCVKAAPASVSPDVFTLTSKESHVAPAAEVQCSPISLCRKRVNGLWSWTSLRKRRPGAGRLPAALAAVVLSDEFSLRRRHQCQGE